MEPVLHNHATSSYRMACAITALLVLLVSGETAAVGQGSVLNINRVRVALTNVGDLARPFEGGYLWGGVAWVNGYNGPNTLGILVYNHGLFIAGKIQGHICAVPMVWYSPYTPGPIRGGLSGAPATPQDSARYHVYRITRGDTRESNSDFSAWPSDLGAPVDPEGAPKVLGDQTLWSVHNGSNVRQMGFDWQPKITPMPVEVHQTVFGHFGTYGDTSVWANAAFIEYAVYNRGSLPIDSMYLSLWTDIDFLEGYTTAPAVDTVRQAGYCWHTQDSSYLAVAYALLYGPCVPAPGHSGTAFGRTRANVRNLPLTSFLGIGDDGYPDGDLMGIPRSEATIWNVMRGLTPGGTPFVDTTTGQTTPFPWSGDPLTHTGMLFQRRYIGGGAGFMMTTGPVSMAPGDSQWIMIALLPEMKHDGVDAITRMRQDISSLRSLPYDSLIAPKARRQDSSRPPSVTAVVPAFSLFPAYPNPFNGTTTFRFTLSARTHMRIEIFDILGRKVEEVANGEFERGYRQVAWTTALASGLYIARIQAQPLEGTGGGISSTQRVLLLR